jgi:hypothetical protein
MSLHEHDPILEQLFRLPRPAEDPDSSADVRRRCHALMAGRVAVKARGGRSARRRRLLSAALVLAVGLYLAAAVVEAVRVVGSF